MGAVAVEGDHSSPWLAEELERRGKAVGESTPVLRDDANVSGKPLAYFFGVAGWTDDHARTKSPKSTCSA